MVSADRSCGPTGFEKTPLCSLCRQTRFITLRVPLPTKILQTKLFIPPSNPEHIPRQRLLERLNSGRGAKLTLVTAPPGFGKTSIIAAWVGQTGLPIGWLSLDQRDNDPAQFFSHFIAALQNLDSSLGNQTLVEVLASPVFSIETLLTDLINEIAGLPGQYLLVLDDLHLVENQSIHLGITFLLEHLPRQLHLVIATRSDPPLPLAKLRAKGQVNEIRVDELRFGMQETDAFLRASVGDTISQNEIAALETRTEGWIAGLQLAMLSIKAHREQSGFIQNFTGSNRYIIDYLVEEVLTQLSDPVRQFLLQTSILDRFCAELCDAMLLPDGSETLQASPSGSQSILDQLERNNIFLIPLDGQRRWYRYHHLFADILRHFLTIQQASLIPHLHRRASGWFAANGLVDEAIDYACAAKDWRLASEHIFRNSRQLLLHGEFYRLIRWVQRLPAEVRHEDLELSIYYAWALLFSGKIEDSEHVFRSVESRLLASQNTFLSVGARILGAFLAYHHGRAKEALPILSEAVERLACEEPTPDEQLLYGFARAGLADTYRLLGKLDLAERAYAEAIPVNLHVGNILAALVCYRNVGDILFEQGQLQKAIETYQEGIDRSHAWTKEKFGEAYDLLPSADHFARLGEVYYERNDLEAAGRMMHKATQMLDLSGSTHLSNAWYQQARIALAGDNLPAVHEHIQKLRQAAARISSRYPFAQTERFIADLRIRIASRPLPPDYPLAVAALQKDIQDWISSFETGAPSRIPYLYDSQSVVLGRAYLYLGQPEKAVALLTPLIETMRSAGRQRSLLERLIVIARAYQMLNDLASASRTIQEALTLAEAHGFLRSIIDDGQELQPLLQRALQQNVAPHYVTRLLNMISSQEPESGSQARANRLLIEPLSDRELEVLALVAEGLSNQQIAEKLYVAISTVKKHMGTIFGKLNVSSRTEAIQRARTLGLI